MLKLKHCTVDESGSGFVATYFIEDKKLGSNIEIQLVSDEKGAQATVGGTCGAGETEEASFDALADQLEALAKAIRGRGQPKLGVPVY